MNDFYAEVCPLRKIKHKRIHDYKLNRFSIQNDFKREIW